METVTVNAEEFNRLTEVAKKADALVSMVIRGEAGTHKFALEVAKSLDNLAKTRRAAK